MNYPATLQELEAAGYGYSGTVKECSCGAQILWFITTKKSDGGGKWMPFSAMEDSRLMPHHAVCQNRADFKRANEKHKERTQGKPAKQEALF